MQWLLPQSCLLAVFGLTLSSVLSRCNCSQDMQLRTEVCQGQTLTNIQRDRIIGHPLCRYSAVCHLDWSRPRKKKLTAAWPCRILLEASPELNRLPQLWLTHLLDHMQRPGQSRDDIVRRSAGLPAAFVALFTAEPTGHPKTLLYTGGTPEHNRTNVYQCSYQCLPMSTNARTNVYQCSYQCVLMHIPCLPMLVPMPTNVYRCSYHVYQCTYHVYQCTYQFKAP